MRLPMPYKKMLITLVSGPTYLTPPRECEFVPVTSAEDMFEAVKTRYDAQDMVFKSAAVSIISQPTN